VKRPVLAASALLVAATVLLAGCSNDPLAELYESGTEQGYISGDGSVKEIPAAERAAPVAWEGVTDAGDAVSSDDYLGEVVVLNFWYAGCPPCRVEAGSLEEVSVEFADAGASFVGVNVRDQAPQSLAFAEELGVTYPSVIDANDGNLLLAFSGTVAPNSVPTTLVIDKEGRLAARILGAIDGPSTLRTLVRETIEEP